MVFVKIIQLNEMKWSTHFSQTPALSNFKKIHSLALEFFHAHNRWTHYSYMHTAGF